MDASDSANGMCLPYDLLLDILRRLPCRALADSRRVCHAWRDIVDGHNLLLPHYFPPRAFPGVFTTNFGCEDESYFLARPASTRRSGFQRPLFRHRWARVHDHCNGLLLLMSDYYSGDNRDTYVCNPATQRYALLPQPPMGWIEANAFLAFDPAVSLHHEVYVLHKEYLKEQVGDQEERGTQLTNEPKAKVVPMLLLSSQTNQWERREFGPGRCVPDHLYEMVTQRVLSVGVPWWSGEYWRGSLYFPCHNEVLMILHCSKRTYDLVQLPEEMRVREKIEYDRGLPYKSILGSYERGICYAVFKYSRLKVWGLEESSKGTIGWMLTHEADLNSHAVTMWDKWVSEYREPKMSWEVVSSKTQVSLFEKSSMKESVQDFGYNHEDDAASDVDEEEVEEEEDGDEDEDVKEEEEDEKEDNGDYDDDDDDHGDDDDDDDVELRKT